MSVADRARYLAETTDLLRRHWPENRTVNIVCHGHSVPAGYFATPMVDSLNAYPHLLHAGLKQRFPFAVINVIVTAIGDENSESGKARFAEDVLCHRPDVITFDSYRLSVIGYRWGRTEHPPLQVRDRGSRVPRLCPGIPAQAGSSRRWLSCK